MPNASQFGRTLKAARTLRKLSQSKLAELAGFDHSYVSRLESGGRAPGTETVAALVKTLELDDGWRSRMYMAAGFAPPSLAGIITEEVLELEQALRRLEVVSPSAHAAALDTVRLITEGVIARYFRL